eukprot:NODE_1164_length_1225_cov_160.329915.p4 GENE.NODE_1164_length_1225_cov_160.329915~~NODE_1164_length_1225_cov_160.329915.p4  ORF type:complete len:57 (+),score=10.80 NODE_1164_length_1225_cov_160.329915:913-1083(+)
MDVPKLYLLETHVGSVGEYTPGLGVDEDLFSKRPVLLNAKLGEALHLLEQGAGVEV